IICKGDSAAGGAVINSVDAGGADAQSACCDIGSSAGAGRSQLIVAGVGAAQTQAGGGDGLVGADVFVGEAGGAAAEADVVAAEHAVDGAGSDRSGNGAVIDLVVGADQRSEGGGGDIGGGAGGGIGGVVGRISATDRDSADQDALGVADGGVGEAGAGVAG